MSAQLGAFAKLVPRSRPTRRELSDACAEINQQIRSGKWSTELVSEVPGFLRSHRAWIKGVNAFDNGAQNSYDRRDDDNLIGNCDVRIRSTRLLGR